MAFVDQGEFEAMKTPIGHRAPHCDKDQFHAKMTSNRLQDIVVEHCGCNKNVASFPGLPRFSSSVCVQYNTRKWKSAKNGEGLVSFIT